MRIDVRVDGIDNVIKGFAAKSLKAQGKVDKVTETYTRKMANDSASMAPVDTGDLRANIASSPRPAGKGAWEYGSNLPYAAVNEYENPTNSGFIRKSVWNNEPKYRKALERVVTKE